MTVTTLSSREFNQDTQRREEGGSAGAGVHHRSRRAAHVLLSIEDYRKLTGGQMSVSEALAQPDIPGVDMDLSSIRRAPTSVSSPPICPDVYFRHQRRFRASSP